MVRGCVCVCAERSVVALLRGAAICPHCSILARCRCLYRCSPPTLVAPEKNHVNPSGCQPTRVWLVKRRTGALSGARREWRRRWRPVAASYVVRIMIASMRSREAQKMRRGNEKVERRRRAGKEASFVTARICCATFVGTTLRGVAGDMLLNARDITGVRDEADARRAVCVRSGAVDDPSIAIFAQRALLAALCQKRCRCPYVTFSPACLHTSAATVLPRQPRPRRGTAPGTKGVCFTACPHH